MNLQTRHHPGMDHRAVDELQVLDVREAELAARAGRLEQLGDDIAAIRARAQEIADFFKSFGAEDNRRRTEIATAENGVSDRQAALSAAEAEAAAARGDGGTRPGGARDRPGSRAPHRG